MDKINLGNIEMFCHSIEDIKIEARAKGYDTIIDGKCLLVFSKKVKNHQHYKERFIEIRHMNGSVKSWRA